MIPKINPVISTLNPKPHDVETAVCHTYPKKEHCESLVTRLEPYTVAKHFEKFHKVTQLQDASKLEPTQRFEEPDETKLPCFGLSMYVTPSHFPASIDII